MTSTLRALAALCLSILALIAPGCGSSGGGAGGNPASVVPESSFVYGEATIDPQGSQESAVRSILADLPGTGAAKDRLENLIRKAARSDKTNKLDWDKDVKPWLGDRVGAFVAGNAQSVGKGQVPAAFIVATTDAGAARDALEKDKAATAAHKRYRDVEYIVETDDKGNITAEGVVDGFVVTGNDAGMQAAIDASKGRTLEDSDQFKQALDGVTDERVGFLYADLGGLIQLATQASGNQIPGVALAGRLLAGRPLVITARAEQQALIFEGKSVGRSGLSKPGVDTRSLMEQLPASTWAAVALPDFGGTIRSFITGFASAFGGQQQLSAQLRAATGLDLERDVVAWIGDVALFADGQTKRSVGGGILIKSKDPAASKRALTKIAAAVAKSAPDARVSAARLQGAFGYELRNQSAPRGIFIVQRGDKVAFTYGASDARAALGSGGLSGSGDFKRAADGLGAGFSPLVYVSMPPILRVADAFGASSDKDYAKARPYLSILDYLVVGSSGDGKNARVRLGFKPHE